MFTLAYVYTVCMCHSLRTPKEGSRQRSCSAPNLRRSPRHSPAVPGVSSLAETGKTLFTSHNNNYAMCCHTCITIQGHKHHTVALCWTLYWCNVFITVPRLTTCNEFEQKQNYKHYTDIIFILVLSTMQINKHELQTTLACVWARGGWWCNIVKSLYPPLSLCRKWRLLLPIRVSWLARPIIPLHPVPQGWIRHRQLLHGERHDWCGLWRITQLYTAEPEREPQNGAGVVRLRCGFGCHGVRPQPTRPRARGRERAPAMGRAVSPYRRSESRRQPAHAQTFQTGKPPSTTPCALFPHTAVSLICLGL